MERKNLLTWNGKQTLKASPGRATRLSTREEGRGISMHGCVCRHVRVCVSKSVERSYMKPQSAPPQSVRPSWFLVLQDAGEGVKNDQIGRAAAAPLFAGISVPLSVILCHLIRVQKGKRGWGWGQ